MSFTSCVCIYITVTVSYLPLLHCLVEVSLIKFQKHNFIVRMLALAALAHDVCLLSHTEGYFHHFSLYHMPFVLTPCVCVAAGCHI